MRRIAIAMLFFAGVLGALMTPLPGVAQIRVGGPVGINQLSRPAVSPYINLGQTGNVPPAIVYYGIVRPELATANSLQQLQLQQNYLTQQQQELNPATLVFPATGHAAGFMTEGKYFLNRGAPGQITGGARPQSTQGTQQFLPTTGQQKAASTGR